jgi:cobaltochelatase CobN
MVDCVYRRLARLLCRWLVVALLLGAAGAQAKTLLWLTADITPAARTALLKQQAEAHGWTWIHIDVPLNLPQADRPAMAQRIEGAARQAELILIDAPHPTAVRLLQGLAPTQAKLPANAPNAPRLAAIPPIWVIDNAGSSASAPTNNAMAKPATAEARLAEYLRDGGLQNTRYAMDLADQLVASGSLGAAASAWTQLPPPKAFPNRGIYFPGATDFFERVPDLQAWMNTQPGLRGRPSVAVLVHRHHFVNGDTGWLDDLLNRFAGRGINAYAVFGQRLDANGLKALYAAQNAAQKVEQPGARPDVVVIHQLVSQPAELQALFTRWNTPALLAVPYRQGDVQAWQADKSGIRQTDVPYYLVQPEAAGAVDPLVIAAHPPEGQPVQLIDRQADALVGKAQRLIALQKTPRSRQTTESHGVQLPSGRR